MRDRRTPASRWACGSTPSVVRAELRPDGIDVVLVSPGTTDTGFFDHLIAERETLPWPKGKAISAA